MDDMDLRKKYVVLRKQLFKITSPITRNQSKKIELLENQINDLGSRIPGKARRKLNYKVKQQMNKNVKLQETEIHQQKHLNEEAGSNIDVQGTVNRFLIFLKGDSSNHAMVMNKKEIKETMYKYVQLMENIYAASVANQISLLESLKEKAICLRSLFPLSVRKMLKRSIKKIIKKCKKDSLGNESVSSVSVKTVSNTVECTVTPSVSVKTESNSLECTVTPSVRVKTESNSLECTVTPSVSVKTKSNSLECTVTPSVRVKTESNSLECTVTPSVSVETESNSLECTVTPSVSVETESNSLECTVTPSVSVKTESNSTEYGSQMLKSQNVIEERRTSEDIVTKRKRIMSCDDSNFLKNKKLKNCAYSSIANDIQCMNEININEGPTKSSPHLPTPETVILENKSNRGWKIIEEELFSNQHFLNNSQLLKSPMTTRTLNSITVSMSPHLS